jgi:hypothetical protein
MDNPVCERSYETIGVDDLRRLARIALADLDDLFTRMPQSWGHYRNRMLLLAFCQGAALHYVAGGHGVKDFDVWAFFRAHPSGPFPWRRNGARDFGPSRFGRHPGMPRFAGRRVDVWGRSIEAQPTEDGVGALRRYLFEGNTESARRLAERPVVAIGEGPDFGRVIWPAAGALA